MDYASAPEEGPSLTAGQKKKTPDLACYVTTNLCPFQTEQTPFQSAGEQLTDSLLIRAGGVSVQFLQSGHEDSPLCFMGGRM